MDTTRCADRRRIRTSTLFGALAWLATPAIPLGTAIPFGSFEHAFLLFPLVAAPLVFALALALLRPEGTARLVYLAAARIQPLAATSVLAAFVVGRGPLAAALVVPWIAMVIAVSVGGLATLRRASHPHLTRINLIAAHLFLPVGTAWLVMSRLGVAPASIPSYLVLLAALHLHFSGFSLQMLVAATARHLPAHGAVARLQRGVSVLAVVGIPLIASGNIARVAALRTVGVAAVVFATLGLAALLLVVALATRDATTCRLTFVSAGSLAAAMLLAGLLRVSDLLGAGWIEVGDMVTSHGVLNAFGFVACGAIAYLRRAAV